MEEFGGAEGERTDRYKNQWGNLREGHRALIQSVEAQGRRFGKNGMEGDGYQGGRMKCPSIVREIGTEGTAGKLGVETLGENGGGGANHYRTVTKI